MMSDYYSEEEQLVGRWTDGKPLYQKVIDCGYGPNSSTKEVDLSALNVDVCIQIGGYMCHSTTNFLPIPRVSDRYIADQLAFNYDNSTKMLKITCRDRDMTAMHIMAILKYTKTTDAPGTGPTKGNLIYLPALYSEEEREVGVWIDGKPLYQKTYRNISITNNADNIIDSNFGTDKNICTHDIEFRGISGNYRSDYNNSVNDTLYSNNNGQLVYYFYKNGNWSQLFDLLDITIQYTKTTDQPGSGTWTPEGQLAHHYSTSEKIVGTWIDDSTIYERTWDLGTPELEFTEDTWVNTTISNANMSAIVNVLARSNSGTYWGFMCANCDAGSYVQLYHSRPSNRTVKVRYITLQYTKTS